MRVTTFYSYKGGLGRTLLLAWVARSLARNGSRVVAIDFDLEAPGLSFKLGFAPNDALGDGLVGLLARFMRGDAPPDSLESWLRPVPQLSNVWLLPAGPQASKVYWRSLAELSWDQLFFGPDAQGARFFHWLRSAIEQTVHPDHILVDARTGVTEMGGATLALMADQVVALVGTSPEGLHGTREVLRGVVTGPRAAVRGRPRIAIALARMPASSTVERLQHLRRAVRGTICEEAEPLTSTLELELPLVIRSEPVLQEVESLALGNDALRVHEDYRRVLDWINGASVPEEIPGLTFRAGSSVEDLRQTIALQRSLAERRPDEYLPDLAQNLLSFGREQLGQGQREAGLVVLNEAIEVYRTLASARPDDFELELASALSDVSMDLSLLVRHEDALRSVQEATAILRRLEKHQTANVVHELARALNNLGMVLANLGRRPEAIEATREAKSYFSRLALTQPDTYTADLAFVLHNLGIWLAELNYREEALQATQESAHLLRSLATDQPASFEPHLASALGNLGARFTDIGQREEALQATLEATAIWRRLAAKHSSAFDSDLAIALNNLAVNLSYVGRREDALIAAQDAVSIRRRLAETSPEVYAETLASALLNLSAHFGDLGRPEQALETIEEAVALYRRLSSTRPERFRPELAMALTNLGTCLSRLGRSEQALQAARDAVDLSRQLATMSPNAFDGHLGTALNNLSVRLLTLGRQEEALDASREAVELYRRIAKSTPDKFEPELANGLWQLGRIQASTDPRLASVTLIEGLRTLLPYLRSLPAAHAPVAAGIRRDLLKLRSRPGVALDFSLLAEIAVLVDHTAD